MRMHRIPRRILAGRDQLASSPKSLRPSSGSSRSTRGLPEISFSGPATSIEVRHVRSATDEDQDPARCTSPSAQRLRSPLPCGVHTRQRAGRTAQQGRRALGVGWLPIVRFQRPPSATIKIVRNDRICRHEYRFVDGLMRSAHTIARRTRCAGCPGPPAVGPPADSPA
jgi:hypothetical protein